MCQHKQLNKVKICVVETRSNRIGSGVVVLPYKSSNNYLSKYIYILMHIIWVLFAKVFKSSLQKLVLNKT